MARDERQSASLVEGARLTGISGTLYAVTQQHNLPNLLMAGVMARSAEGWTAEGGGDAQRAGHCGLGDLSAGDAP